MERFGVRPLAPESTIRALVAPILPTASATSGCWRIRRASRISPPALALDCEQCCTSQDDPVT
ncbi:MAG: hypothetical protein WKF43_12305 [Acidimicrobiales bacterium]